MSRMTIRYGVRLCVVFVVASMLTVMLTGCGREQPTAVSGSAEPPATNAPLQNSAAQAVIEDVTGKTAVDAGRRAQEQIRRINEQRNKNMEM